MAAKLLIVDDEDSILEFLSLLFESEGFAVDTAHSTAEAQRALAANSYALVLCDILMPDGNGLDLLREIKAGSPSTAVVMMTAFTSTKTAIEAMRLGAYDAAPTPGSKIAQIYGATDISERHRHRYEVNIGYREAFEGDPSKSPLYKDVSNGVVPGGGSGR